MRKTCPRCGSELKRRNQVSGNFKFVMTFCPECGWHRTVKARVEKPKFTDEDVKRAVEKVKKSIDEKLKDLQR
jgi:DNA-directed RNA polymerase subunit RPC12/RpoP